ncbi:aldehyde dehydrogenase family protein [Marinivivus vitaminiproducens]|uniref:aldehyde dehydrogenase family protein n=1 Tax=Marinivivus vitaminiproducens TaxID=3035935 RepID=UPI00279CD749|nr:aldehyde dehydrogenase family protein [Geminicoccaceae bacterium SCSIO 64248]
MTDRCLPDAGAVAASARKAQAAWAARAVAERTRILDRIRRPIARAPEALLIATAKAAERPRNETLASEILPLLDACRFLRRRAHRILRDRHPSRRLRPLWLAGLGLRIRREPWGIVLIIAPGNYPLFLPGVQILQALAAGNAVLVKPAPGCAGPMKELAVRLDEAGLPDGLLTVLDEDPKAASTILDAGVDHVVLTGSATTGRAVLAALAPSVTPATLELSGCDALIALPEAGIEAVADAALFGLLLNRGRVCVGVRHVWIDRARAAALERTLTGRLGAAEPVALPPAVARSAQAVIADALARGGRLATGGFAEDGRLRPTVLADVAPDALLLRSDLFAPVLGLCGYDDTAQAVDTIARGPYRLGASVFGPRRAAEAVADRLDVGMVTINDVIVPGADPRLPFAGRGASGHGATRGADGLLGMTRVKAIASRRSQRSAHLRRRSPPERVWRFVLRLLHGYR